MSRNNSTVVFGTLLFALMLGLVMAGCSGGSGAFAVSPDSLAPSGLSYYEQKALYGRDVLVNPNVPSVTGTVQHWSIQPALPTGLEFDKSSGVISGTPSALSPQRAYTVRASNVHGSTTTELQIGVVLSTTFAISGNVQDDTLSLFEVNAKTGIPFLWSYVKAAPGESYPHDLVAHPSGSPIYVVNRDTDNLSIYDLDFSNGFLQARAPVAAGTLPARIVLHPSGTAAYVTLAGGGYVQAYSIGPTTKGLVPLGSPVFSGAGAGKMVIDAAGSFLYVANSSAGTLSTFAIDPVSMALDHVGVDVATGLNPHAMAWSHDERFLFVTCLGDGSISTFTVDDQTGLPSFASSREVGKWPSSLVTDPFGGYLHVTLTGENRLLTFLINSATGALKPAGTPMLTGLQPNMLHIDATGKRVFVVDTGSWEVALFTVDRGTGNLTGRESSRTREAPLGFTVFAPSEQSGNDSQYAYVANRDSSSLSMFKTGEEGTQLTRIGPDLSTDLLPSGIASDPWSKYVFAIHAGVDSLSSYRIEAADGALTEIGSAIGTGSDPRGIEVDLSGRYLYVSNSTSSDISLYDLDIQTGVPKATGSYQLANQPAAMALEPTGRFLYTADLGVNGITVLRIDPYSGVLTPSASRLSTGAVPSALEVHPTGRYLYAAFRDTGEVRQYEIDKLNGALSHFSTVYSGTQPTSISIDQRGRWGFVTNYDAYGVGDISIFAINMTSGLPTYVASQVAGLNPVSAVVGPSGRNLFVVNQGSDDLMVFRIKTSDGSLSLEDTISAGVAPQSVVVTGSFTN